MHCHMRISTDDLRLQMIALERRAELQQKDTGDSIANLM